MGTFFEGLKIFARHINIPREEFENISLKDVFKDIKEDPRAVGVVGTIFAYSIEYIYFFPCDNLLTGHSSTPVVDEDFIKYTMACFKNKPFEQQLSLYTCYKEVKKYISRMHCPPQHIFYGLMYTPIYRLGEFISVQPVKTLNLLCCPACGSYDDIYYYMDVYEFNRGLFWLDHRYRMYPRLVIFKCKFKKNFEYENLEEACQAWYDKFKNTENYLNSLRQELREYMKNLNAQDFLSESALLKEKAKELIKTDNTDMSKKILDDLERQEKDFLAN